MSLEGLGAPTSAPVGARAEQLEEGSGASPGPREACARGPPGADGIDVLVGAVPDQPPGGASGSSPRSRAAKWTYPAEAS